MSDAELLQRVCDLPGVWAIVDRAELPLAREVSNRVVALKTAKATAAQGKSVKLTGDLEPRYQGEGIAATANTPTHPNGNIRAVGEGLVARNFHRKLVTCVRCEQTVKVGAKHYCTNP